MWLGRLWMLACRTCKGLQTLSSWWVVWRLLEFSHPHTLFPAQTCDSSLCCVSCAATETLWCCAVTCARHNAPVLYNQAWLSLGMQCAALGGVHPQTTAQGHLSPTPYFPASQAVPYTLALIYCAACAGVATLGTAAGQYQQALRAHCTGGWGLRCSHGCPLQLHFGLECGRFLTGLQHQEHCRSDAGCLSDHLSAS